MLMRLPKNACRAKLLAKSVNSQPPNAPDAYQRIHLVPLPHPTQLQSALEIAPPGLIWTRLKVYAYPVSLRAIHVIPQLPSVCHARQTISGWKENLNAIRNVLSEPWLCKAPFNVQNALLNASLALSSPISAQVAKGANIYSRSKTALTHVQPNTKLMM